MRLEELKCVKSTFLTYREHRQISFQAAYLLQHEATLGRMGRMKRIRGTH